MNQRVTLVVVQREQFSLTEQSLESIYQNTSLPFKLVYVDTNSPSKTKQYLEIKAIEKNFKLIKIDHFISPNCARNIVLQSVDTEYVVFIDNDVLVKPGWLEALVQCADETGAWIVGPLCMEGANFDKVHMAGGALVSKQRGGQKWLAMKRPWFRTPLAKVRTEFKRQPSDVVELHCCLAHRDVFEQLGPLDEQIINVGSEEDLCLTVLKAGKSIYFEPTSVMTYVPPTKLSTSDIPLFFTRWSQAWADISIKRFQEKWNLTRDSPVIRGYKVFIKAHKYDVCPKPNQTFAYPSYVIRKASIKLIEKLFNAKTLLTLTSIDNTYKKMLQKNI